MKINFSRGVGGSLSYFVEIPGGEGGGDHLFLAIWKTREVGGGGPKVKFPLWWGMDIFGTTQYEICMLILSGL